MRAEEEEGAEAVEGDEGAGVAIHLGGDEMEAVAGEKTRR